MSPPHLWRSPCEADVGACSRLGGIGGQACGSLGGLSPPRRTEVPDLEVGNKPSRR